MTFQQALDYLYSLTDFESRRNADYKLTNYTPLNTAKLVESVENQPTYIHIAGTNGKGTTAFATEYLLLKSGKTVGTFTSPHIVNILERFRINGRCISEREFVESVEWAKMRTKALNIKPTTFDTMTAVAVRVFSRKKVDIGILEVGLGGRLDSTNFCVPAVSIITHIDYDHTDKLGSSLQGIAEEKAGIIKAGVPVVVGVQYDEVYEVLEKRADVMGSKVVKLEDEISFDVDVSGEGTTVEWWWNGADSGKKKWLLPVYGRQFAENVLLAFLSLNVGGFEVSDRDFWGEFKICGRFQIEEVQGRKFVFDVAHNPSSVAVMVETFKTLWGNRKVPVVFNLASDKDLEGVVTEIVKVADQVFVLDLSGSYRWIFDTGRIVEGIKERGIKVKVLRSAGDVLSEVKSDLVIVCGSFKVVGEVVRDLGVGC